MTIRDILDSGVYVPVALLVLFIVVIVIWCVRGSFLSKCIKSNVALMHRIRDFVTEGDIESAVNATQGAPFTPGARVLGAGLQCLGRPIPEISASMQSAVSNEDFYLRRGRIWLAAIAVMAPLLGIAGTVCGITVALAAVVDPEPAQSYSLLAPQISASLVTSIIGFVTGLFAIIAYCSVGAMAQKAANNLRNLSGQFIKLLEEPC